VNVGSVKFYLHYKYLDKTGPV